MSLRFALLVLEDHPYGREMLRVLLDQGFRPRLIVQERSRTADEERCKFLARIQGQVVPQEFQALPLGSIPVEFVSDHNSPGCLALLCDLAPDLLVLGGTRILRPSVLHTPARGTLNAHPGLLPRLRGSSSVAWAIYKDLPVGVTVHFVDQGIDTGPIILQRQLAVYRGETYEQIVRRVLTLAGELMAQALSLMVSGDLAPVPQARDAGETLRVIPPELLLKAKDSLARGAYGHYAG